MAPFNGYRVVEIGGSVAGAYAGKLFSDFGADVVLCEPPAGTEVRKLPPHPAGERESAYAAWLQTNKSSVIVSDQAELAELVAHADLLIDSRPMHGAKNVLAEHERFRGSNNRLTVLSLSWFGESGPYRDFRATDLVCRALAGLVKLVGPSAGPPFVPQGHVAEIVGGMTAFIAAAANLFDPKPADRRISLSILESNVPLAECNFAQRARPEVPKHRLGVNRFAPTYPLGVFECKEGWLGVTIVTPDQWRTLCFMLGLADFANDPAFSTSLGRLGQADRIEAALTEQLRTKTANEWFDLGLKSKLPLVAVPSVGELLNLPHYKERAAFAEVKLGEHSFQAPALPQRVQSGRSNVGGRAPAVGSSEIAEIVRAWRDSPSVDAKPGAGGAKLPLEGVTIVDLSMGWAGPLATRHMADLGANVIKVEACQYPDWWRGVEWTDEALESRRYEKNMQFLMMNRGKKGITLDLTTHEGSALLKELVKDADVVVENYSAGVLAKLGLDYGSLRKSNNNLIMLSMSAFGGSGSWSECRAYGSTLEQASGMPTVGGQEGWPPMMSHLAFGDPVGGTNGATAILVGLFQRRQTGGGGHIDVSQVECMFPLFAHAIIAQSIHGAPPPRLGMHHTEFVPHGCFACKGDDQWVALSVTSGDEWKLLCGLIGRSDWAASSSALSNPEKRRASTADIEAAVTDWTRSRTADEAMHALQDAGIPAGAVRSPFELLEEPHLAARGFWQVVQREIAGHHLQASAPYRYADGPLPVTVPAPLLGEHSEVILKERLGLNEQEIRQLNAKAIIGRVAMPRLRTRSDNKARA